MHPKTTFFLHRTDWMASINNFMMIINSQWLRCVCVCMCVCVCVWGGGGGGDSKVVTYI